MQTIQHIPAIGWLIERPRPRSSAVWSNSQTTCSSVSDRMRSFWKNRERSANRTWCRSPFHWAAFCAVSPRKNSVFRGSTRGRLAKWRPRAESVPQAAMSRVSDADQKIGRYEHLLASTDQFAAGAEGQGPVQRHTHHGEGGFPLPNYFGTRGLFPAAAQRSSLR